MSVSLEPENGFFQRYSAPDFSELEQQIARGLAALTVAQAQGDRAGQVRQAVELGNLLTTARREQEACEVLGSGLILAQEAGAPEPLGWLYLHLGTARQYLGDRDGAQALFAQAAELARINDLRMLASYVLHHRGRCLAEQRKLAEARDCFSQALALRQALNDPRAQSSQRALEALDALEP